MKQGLPQPSQLPVVLCCPGPHLWSSMLPKTGTHSPENSVNGPLLLRGVNLLVAFTKVLFTFSSFWKSLLWSQMGKTSNLSSQQMVLWHYTAVLVIQLAHGEYHRGPLFLLFFFLSKKDEGNAVSGTWGCLKHTEKNYACSRNPRFVSDAT